MEVTGRRAKGTGTWDEATRRKTCLVTHSDPSPPASDPTTIRCDAVERCEVKKCQNTTSNLFLNSPTGLAWGISRGHQTERRVLAPRPANRKGRNSERVQTIRSVIREVAGFAPYERRAMELIRNSKVRVASGFVCRPQCEFGTGSGRRVAWGGPSRKSVTRGSGISVLGQTAVLV